MKKHLPAPLIALLLLLFGVLAITQRPGTFYPLVEVEAPDASTAGGNLKLTFLFHNRPTLTSCETLTGNIARVTLANCKQCAVRQVRCLTELDAGQRELLSDRALPTPSGRMANGVVNYHGASADITLASCQVAERQSSGRHAVKCFPANATRPQPASPPIDLSQIGSSLLVFLTAAFGAWLVCWLIIKYERLHARFSHDHVGSGPQKFHAMPTPRIGGASLVVGLITGGGMMMLAERLPYEREFGFLLLAGIPAFLGGLVEDITKKFGVLERLLLSMLSGAIAVWLLGAVLNRLDVPGLDQALRWLPFAIVFTVFAVGGVVNAINIIDGYNGLAGGYAFIVLIAIAAVAGQVGDMLVFPAALAMAGALLGFLKWNWPGGKIFLGDGGAYLLGFILAELSVLLVTRNPEVSPWLPLLLLIHPIFETLFSIYRRKFLRHGHAPGRPDALHMHQLVFLRLIRIHVGSRKAHEKLYRNNKVAPYFWGMAIIVAVLSGLCWRSTPALFGLASAYCVIYVITYRRITMWRTGLAARRRQAPVHRDTA